MLEPLQAPIDEEGKVLAEDHKFLQFVGMSRKEKDLLTCDHILNLYLGYVSKQVNAVYYRTVTKFVLMFRDCMN